MAASSKFGMVPGCRVRWAADGEVRAWRGVEREGNCGLHSGEMMRGTGSGTEKYLKQGISAGHSKRSD